MRFILSGQSAWPEYELLFRRSLAEYETGIDSNFDRRLDRNSSFEREICGPATSQDLWIDYEFYVRTLFATR